MGPFSRSNLFRPHVAFSICFGADFRAGVAPQGAHGKVGQGRGGEEEREEVMTSDPWCLDPLMSSMTLCGV